MFWDEMIRSQLFSVSSQPDVPGMLLLHVLSSRWGAGRSIDAHAQAHAMHPVHIYSTWDVHLLETIKNNLRVYVTVILYKAGRRSIFYIVTTYGGYCQAYGALVAQYGTYTFLVGIHCCVCFWSKEAGISCAVFVRKLWMDRSHGSRCTEHLCGWCRNTVVVIVSTLVDRHLEACARREL